MDSDKFYEETEKKISNAKQALNEPHCWFGPNVHELVDEFTALNIESTEEIWPLLQVLLDEIKPNNRVASNTFFSPSEAKSLDCEMFVFTWDSETLKCNVTLKFALNESHFYYLSLKKNLPWYPQPP